MNTGISHMDWVGRSTDQRDLYAIHHTTYTSSTHLFIHFQKAFSDKGPHIKTTKPINI